MLKLTHTTRNAALAGVLAAGLAGSAAVTLMPVAGHAQDRDDGYYQDRDGHADFDAGYRRGYVDRDRDGDRDWYRYHRWDQVHRTWVGIGVPGFGIGFYDTPTYYNGPYCSSWDYDHGYCDY